MKDVLGLEVQVQGLGFRFRPLQGPELRCPDCVAKSVAWSPLVRNTAKTPVLNLKTLSPKT